MWLARVLDALTHADQPVAVVGGEAYGAPFLIDALRHEQRVAWLDLPPRLRDDPVGQGNELANAINHVAGAPLLPHALPYKSHLQALRRYREDLAPLWIAVSHAEAAPHLVADLKALQAQHPQAYRVLLDLHVDPPPADLVTGCLVLDSEALRLLPSEAPQVAPGALDAGQVETLYRAASGRFTPFLVSALEAARLPVMPVPGPAGTALPASQREVADVPVAVLGLRREGRLLEALELAVMRAPELVDELLRAAGPAYQEEGLMPRLHLLLSSLPEPFRTQPRVLEWRLVGALAAGELPGVVEEVDTHLASFIAPDLRARRAGTLPRPKGFPLAEQAVKAKRTPLTVWQYGRMHPDAGEGARILQEAVTLAEDTGTPYDVARAANSLANKLLDLGDYARAASWTHWALQTFDEHHLRDGARRLLLYNDFAVARIFTGDLAGLRRGLEDAHASIEGSMPRLATFYRGTLAWLEQASGRPEAALALTREAFEASPRGSRTRYAWQLVRSLNEFELHDEALRVAQEALDVGADPYPHRRLAGLLARGMARALAGQDGAEDDLAEVMLRRELPADHRLAAALHYLLVTDGAAHNVPQDLTGALASLHPAGLRVLSGPAPRFQPVWDNLSPGSRPEVRLELLGRATCRYGGQEINLSLRMAEAALALALHPQGMTRDEINAFLSPEDGRAYSKSGTRGLLTRLRAVLPVSESPYRFTTSVAVDALEARQALQQQRVREAVTLLQGPLLPDSDASGVVEQRWALEEELRQAALLAADADALFELSDRLGDDLELWEATVDALGGGDPRAAIAQARVQRLRREYDTVPDALRVSA